MKIKKIISIILIILLVAVGITACKNKSDESSNNYYQSKNDDENNDNGDNGDELSSDENNSSEEANTFSLTELGRTEELAQKIYTAMEEHSFENYRPIDGTKWKELSSEERNQVYESFSGILSDIGFPVNTKEEEWFKLMDEDADFYNDTLIWGFGFGKLGLQDSSGADESETLIKMYFYAKGINDGKYEPLNPEIFEVADDITVEHHLGQYLLCVGGYHDIAQITKEWTRQDSWFTQIGSITPINTGDIFKNQSISYSIDGTPEKFTNINFGEADLMPVLKELGAISEDGSMLNEQVQISAKSLFDARKLFVLTQDNSGVISFATLIYDEDAGKHVWDGEIIKTAARACFDNEANFCYIDENGELQKISME